MRGDFTRWKEVVEMLQAECRHQGTQCKHEPAYSWEVEELTC